MNITKNTRISNIKVSNPLIISFDFVLNKKMNQTCAGHTYQEGLCCRKENKTCNLIQFGISNTYDDPRAEVTFTNDPKRGLSLPSISAVFKSGNWLWNITTHRLDKTTVLGPNNWAVPISKKSSFYIIFTNTKTQIWINSLLYYNSTANDAWKNSIGESHPFYISNQDDDQLIGNVSNICILTDSIAPTQFPTSHPIKSPTPSPSWSPTAKKNSLSPTTYAKINCYTETGNPGDLTVSCSQSGYIITSCGIELNDNLSELDRIFYKGSYIKRQSMNELNTDGVCHIDYNFNIEQPTSPPTSSPTISSPRRLSIILNPPRPQARCCDFKTQFNQAFRCRYFESELPTNRINEYSYATCDDKFPLLLSCGTRVDESSKKHVASSQDYISFYGTFQSNMNRKKNQYQYNPDYNYYFKLKTGTTKAIPLAPPPTSEPTTADNNLPTISPTIPTQPPTTAKNKTDGSLDVVKLDHSHIKTHCVAQHGSETSDYSVIAIATCCTDKFNTSTSPDDVSKYKYATPNPTPPPTFKKRLYTAYFGPNGTTTKTLSTDPTDRDFFENENQKRFLPLAGITEWGIFQVFGERKLKSAEKKQTVGIDSWWISYQGILIGKYSVWNENGTKVETSATGDYGDEIGHPGTSTDYFFSQIRQCSSFELDIVNGTKDYINGFDVYNTTMTVFGITFYTAFGRKYSCPDNENFVDDSKIYKGAPGGGKFNNVVLNDTYYKMTNISIENAFPNSSTYGTYKLSGWRGTYQPRQFSPAVIRRLYASIAFSFVFDDTVNTFSPTNTPTTGPPTGIPTIAPSKKKSPTLTPTKGTSAPSIIGQGKSETLVCYSRFNNGSVTCETPSNRVDNKTMTGCNGYSVEGQVFRTSIIDNITSKTSQCVVSTINDKPAAAIATCCYFKPPIERNWNVFIYTSIAAGVIFVIMFIIICAVLFFNIKNKKYFDPEDVDDDTLIDKRVEDVGSDVAKSKIVPFKVSVDDWKQMQELDMQPDRSDSIGLQK
eukprot:529282_1